MKVRELIEKLSVIQPDALVTVSTSESSVVSVEDELYLHATIPGHHLTSITLLDPCLDCQRIHGTLNHCTKTCKNYSDFVPMKGKATV